MQGGWSRRSGNWPFTISTSSGFNLAAPTVPTDKPGPGCDRRRVKDRSSARPGESSLLAFVLPSDDRGTRSSNRGSLAGQTACVNSLLKPLVRQTGHDHLVNGQVNGYHQITVIRTAGTPSRLARRAPRAADHGRGTGDAAANAGGTCRSGLPLYPCPAASAPSGLTELNHRDQVTTVHRSDREAVKGLQTGGILSSCLPAALCTEGRMGGIPDKELESA